MAEKKLCQGCCWAGLALGEAALYGCSHCLCPVPRGTTHLSHSTLSELGGDAAQGWNTGCHQVSLFCYQHQTALFPVWQ